MTKDQTERMVVAIEDIAASLKIISHENDEPGIIQNTKTGLYDLYCKVNGYSVEHFGSFNTYNEALFEQEEIAVKARKQGSDA